MKIGSQPPWYDEDLRMMKKEVDKARIKARKNPENSDLLADFHEKETVYRHESHSKELSYLNMSQICDQNRSAEVSKKFFKHVKSKTNSSRIPDTIYYKEKFRTDTSEKSEMFNEFFADQFTESSKYDFGHSNIILGLL